MASTDSPLKRLVSTFISDFAAWLLKAQVREARPLNVELPGETLAVDQVFRVVLTDGREVILHIEFQGCRSCPPMPWRMLEYISRLAGTYRLELLSVVFYVGRGAGADDTGHHQVQSPTGGIGIIKPFSPHATGSAPSAPARLGTLAQAGQAAGLGAAGVGAAGDAMSAAKGGTRRSPDVDGAMVSVSILL